MDAEKKIKEQKEIEMFGETIEEMKEAAIFTNMKDPYDLTNYAMGILSDSQQVLDSGEKELARKFINKAKFFLSEANRINRAKGV